MNKSNLKNKIIIGSANFTQKYGANPTKVKTNEIKKIFKLAKKNNIFEIDSAEAYLKDKKIFQNIDYKFSFSSKILPDARWISEEFCRKKLDEHFKYFNTNKVRVIFFHDTKILFSKNGKKIFKNLNHLKKIKLFDKIGLSIYDTNALSYIISNYDLDVIQCAYNILDKRIITTGWFDKLKKLGFEIHVRSIFLQGLLVNRKIHKKKYFEKWQKKISQWFLLLKKNKISPIDYCLSDVMTHDFDKIIIGINNLNNLKEILNFQKINLDKDLNLKINDLKLIDPRKWK